MPNVILVGAIPNPIGGVSSFIYRLCHKDKGNDIEEVIDPYYHMDKENIPKKIKHTLISSDDNKLTWLYKKLLLKKNKIIHFNFSSIRSLFLFLFLPKKNNRWILTLHHGKISAKNKFLQLLISFILKKMDVIFCLSESQKKMYIQYKVTPSKIISTTSYIYQLGRHKNKNNFFKNWEEKSKNYPIKFVSSGYPTKIYNHFETLNEIIKYDNAFLALFLYGDDSDNLLKDIIKYSSYHNIEIYQHKSQNDFNKVLAKSHVYLRPNSVDSFGIVVADAINLGLKVIASDVCQRYKGTTTFHTMDEYKKIIYRSLQGHITQKKHDKHIDSFKDYVETYKTLNI